MLGFKVGYQIDDTTFYSWFGGVSSSARKAGIAQALLYAQQKWAFEQGYKQIKVKSRNQFPSMLRLLIKNGYLIEKYEKKEPSRWAYLFYKATRLITKKLNEIFSHLDVDYANENSYYLSRLRE